MWRRPDNKSAESRDTGFSPCPGMGKDGNEDNRKTPPEFITPIAFKQELPTRHNHIPEGNHHQA